MCVNILWQQRTTTNARYNMTKLQLPKDSIREVSPGVYVTGDLTLHNRNLKGWVWGDLKTLDDHLIRHAKSENSELLPDYLGLPLSTLSPGSSDEFMWIEIKDGRASLKIASFEECPFMRGVSEGTQILLSKMYIIGVQNVFIGCNIRRFITRDTVHLLDGRTVGFDLETMSFRELACAA
jgi:hypothetical protein